jgi:hypothetical protein
LLKIKWKSKNKQRAKRPLNISDYLYSRNFAGDEPWQIQHPTNGLCRRDRIVDVCRQRLSTQAVEFLENLYGTTSDAELRGLLARKSYSLRRDYLRSFREYSDAALMLLSQREKFFDKWEGIFILGCFGTERSISQIQGWLAGETDPVLKQALERAIEKIRSRNKQKIRERGF